MAMTIEYLVYGLETITVLAILFAMKEKLAAGMYGVRYVKYQEIDTGRRGYIILDKALNSCTVNGMKKSINRSNIIRNVAYFTSEVCENVKVEEATDKYQFYMNSEEFDTVYKNKLLSTLMLSLQNNLVLIVLMLVLLAIAIGGYHLYTFTQEQSKIDYIVWRVNQTYATGY